MTDNSTDNAASPLSTRPAGRNDSQRIDELLGSILADRKQERRFKYIRFFVFLGFFAVYAIVIGLARSGIGADDAGPAEPYAALVRIQGEIGTNRPVSFKGVSPLLERAFKDPDAKGIILLVNSPGGSPVQSSLIHDRILQLKAENPSKKVVVVAEDTIASGGYFIGVAADKIVVNRSTVAGSIGVISQQFGVTGLMEKIGVESRTLTAGESKNRLSPFETPTTADRDKIKTVLSDIHSHFKDVVREGRKGKLTRDESEIFNGDFWTGQAALELGLVDELGDLPGTLKKEFGVTRYREYSPKLSFIESITKGLSVELSAQLANSMAQAPVEMKASFE